jgi:type I restriction enzyme, S subunit
MTTHPLFGNELPQNWRLTTVDSIKADDKSSCVAGPFGSNIASKFFVDDGVPVIRGSNLRDDLTRFVPEGFAFVSEDRANKYLPQHVRGGDLVFTCWGTIGQVGLIPSDGPYPEYIISNKQLKLRPNPEIAHPLYLFYYFASPAMVDYIRSRAIGSAVPGINLGILKALPVVLPPLSTQRRIAAALGAYDDLIENNQRRIEILQAMAQSIYLEWFVNFRFPGSENAQAIESALGRIPQDWTWGRLKDIVTNVRTATKAGPHLSDRPYVPIDCITSKSLVLTEARPWQEAKSSLFLFEADDVLFGAMRPYFHKVALAPEPGVTRSTCLVLRAVDGYLFYALMVLFQDATITYATSHSRGTTIPYAAWEGSLSEMPTRVPTKEVAEGFGNEVRPMFDLAQRLVLQNLKLRETRDLLLPRLIAGEIDVSELDIDTSWLAA